MRSAYVLRVDQKSTKSEHTLESELQASLYVKILRYKRLKDDEKTLRKELRGYEDQLAQLGFSPSVEIPKINSQIDQLKAELEKHRADLIRLKNLLDKEKDIPPEKKTEIDATRLEQLLSDLKYKRIEFLKYQENIAFLEQQQANLAMPASLALVNQIAETKRKLSAIEVELDQLAQEIKSEWNFDLASAQNLTDMDDSAIRVLAQDIYAGKVAHEQEKIIRDFRAKDERAKKEKEIIKSRTEELKKLHNASVGRVLLELRDAVYPRFQIYGWGIYREYRQGAELVTVSLDFINASYPPSFKCRLYNGTGKIMQETRSTGLSTTSLIKALCTLHVVQKKKRWWQFWVKPLPPRWRE